MTGATGRGIVRFIPRGGLLRVVAGVLLVLLAAAFYLRANPALLRRLVLALPIPGYVEIPDFGPAPFPPEIDIPPGSPPAGSLALRGSVQGVPIGCGFLLELDDGRRLGVSAAHATLPLPRQVPGEFRSSAGELAASLNGQLQIGKTFLKDRFDDDYALWSVAPGSAGPFLQPDPRGEAQPGERVWVFGPGSDGRGGSIRWPGTVMSSSAQAAWLQMDGSFDPRGYSGCPVVSQHSGRLVGMAVAAEQRPFTVIGLHPAGSLVEKAQKALNKQ